MLYNDDCHQTLNLIFSKWFGYYHPRMVQSQYRSQACSDTLDDSIVKSITSQNLFDLSYCIVNSFEVQAINYLSWDGRYRIFFTLPPIHYNFGREKYNSFLWTRSAESIDFTGFVVFSPIITPAGEFIGARQGLGYLIIYGTQVFKLDWVIMSIIILCIVAMGLYSLINLLEKVYSKRA